MPAEKQVAIKMEFIKHHAGLTSVPVKVMTIFAGKFNGAAFAQPCSSDVLSCTPYTCILESGAGDGKFGGAGPITQCN